MNIKCTIVMTIVLINGLFAYKYNAESKDATKYTRKINEKIYKDLLFSNKQDFDFATRGFVAPLPHNGVIKTRRGKILWNISKYKKFIGDNIKFPYSINPSLYRKANLSLKSGIFKITKGVYQIRGFGLANMTFIEGNGGITIANPLVSETASKAALKLYYKYRPHKPIVAIILSHSYSNKDSIFGLISREDLKNGTVRIYAPKNSGYKKIDRKILASDALSIQHKYLNGYNLKESKKGAIYASKRFISYTTVTPTDIIEDDETDVIDGNRYEFITIPYEDSSILMWYIPQKKLLNMSIYMSHSLLTNGKTRDILKFINFLNRIIRTYGNEYMYEIATYDWPTYGNANINNLLKTQRDAYKFIHDRSLHLINLGYSVDEVANMVKLPKSLSKRWMSRSYYKTINDTSYDIYNQYLDHINATKKYITKENSKKFVKMVGTHKIMSEAHKAYKNGDYKWACSILTKLTLVKPNNRKARLFLADNLEQLGYQSESLIWRNIYLTEAKELRMDRHIKTKKLSTKELSNLPLDTILNYTAIRLDYEELNKKIEEFTINLIIIDTGAKYTLFYKNSVLNYWNDYQNKKADITITTTKESLVKLLSGKYNITKLPNTKIKGSITKLRRFVRSLTTFSKHSKFSIIRY